MSRLQEWKHELGHAWESLADGWRELGERAGSALTRFRPRRASGDAGAGPASASEELPLAGSWAFLAADVFDDDDRVVVRLEAPGMKREDFTIDLHDDVLSVRGDKRFERESSQGNYRVMQCAYGSFRRDVRLPAPVRADKARASYRDGVLRVELPKTESARARRIEVRAS
jgi:HSP20 family protein